MEGKKEMDGRKGRKRIDLTDRDLEMVEWCHRMKFLTWGHVLRWFPGVSRGIRIAKLVKYGVVERVPVFVERAGAYTVGELGYGVLVNKGLDGGMSRLNRIDIKSFDHDARVTDLRWKLERELKCIESWTAERQMWRDYSTKAVPDGAVKTKTGAKVFVDLELTVKSQKRYEALFLSYARRSYERVLFIVPSEQHLKTIATAVYPRLNKKPELWGAFAPPLERVFYGLLPSIESAGLAAPVFSFRGGQGQKTTLGEVLK
jgi:hypothetical protein